MAKSTLPNDWMELNYFMSELVTSTEENYSESASTSTVTQPQEEARMTSSELILEIVTSVTERLLTSARATTSSVDSTQSSIMSAADSVMMSAITEASNQLNPVMEQVTRGSTVLTSNNTWGSQISSWLEDGMVTLDDTVADSLNTVSVNATYWVNDELSQMSDQMSQNSTSLYSLGNLAVADSFMVSWQTFLRSVDPESLLIILGKHFINIHPEPNSILDYRPSWSKIYLLRCQVYSVFCGGVSVCIPSMVHVFESD